MSALRKADQFNPKPLKICSTSHLFLIIRGFGIPQMKVIQSFFHSFKLLLIPQILLSWKLARTLSLNIALTSETLSIALIPPRTLLRGPKASEAWLATSTKFLVPSTIAPHELLWFLSSEPNNSFSTGVGPGHPIGTESDISSMTFLASESSSVGLVVSSA